MKSILVTGLVLAFVISVSAQHFVEVPVKKDAKSRVALAETTDLKNADPLMTANVPNYIKALAQTTKAASQFANLVQAFLYGGTVAPETKMAMGLKISQIYKSGYISAHSTRWLKASDKGNAILSNFKANQSLSEAELTAIRYAELLTNDIHGVSDADFAKTRAFYNDSQIVELTMTVCFFNYFTRLVEALNLPVENWVLEGNPKTPEGLAKVSNSNVRVALISDDEMASTQKALETAKAAQTPAQSLGIGIANSQRAMLRVPALANAWREFGTQNRANWTIERNIQLQISFAVSMVNGCRYCTLHQVLGLRRLGVEVSKLVAMKKDDSALTPRELTAVEFARKLTTEPNSTTDTDFAKLKKEFGEQGAVEVIMQTGSFAFMNRFTDGLRLPSEDEAVKVYQETYGDGTYKTDWQKR